jgi:hypothetical protein
LTQKFEDEVKKRRKYLTPGTSSLKIQKFTKEMEVLDADHQKKYTSGVGMLLYLTKYSRPDIRKIVRELLKCKYSATWGSYCKPLQRVIKFVVDTKTLGLKVEPKLDDDLG